MKKDLSGIGADALRLLIDYHWPGNVRELENVMERAVILARGDQVTSESLPMSKQENDSIPHQDGDWQISLEALEREHIQVILHKTGYHKSRTAELLGISRKTLDRKIAEYGLESGRSRAYENIR